MVKTQILKIVKLFKFKLYNKDVYKLKMDDTTIFLFYFQDKPKGWRINISSRGDNTFQRQLKHPRDLLMFLMEYASKEAQTEERRIFRNKLSGILRTL